uniref:Uncharacterized protein n=1 Tax=Chlamydomonas euryale TaxID=1486919 RepID=A0A7R9Z0B5_9CHLO|mmetsp:Transcript_3696/g.10433  ORF Transcript_3696/g.10433 Transcript_3696/m.10433 type:complete len:107 (+) Transcript_3696:289-609(+)
MSAAEAGPLHGSPERQLPQAPSCLSGGALPVAQIPAACGGGAMRPDLPLPPFATTAASRSRLAGQLTCGGGAGGEIGMRAASPSALRTGRSLRPATSVKFKEPEDS